jgi:hypothetical protein
VTAPEGWKASCPADIDLAPGDRKEIALVLTSPAGKEFALAEIRIRGDFGAAGSAVLALRLVPRPK